MELAMLDSVHKRLNPPSLAMDSTMAAIFFNSLPVLLMAIWTPLVGVTISERSNDDRTSQSNCSAAAPHALIGEYYSEAIHQQAKALSSADSVRTLQQGDSHDLSIVSNRLTITLDHQYRVLAFSCD